MARRPAEEMVPLTVPRIDNLPQGDHRDRKCPGLILRVYEGPRGRSLTWRYQIDGHVYTLGPYHRSDPTKGMGLSEAREALGALKHARRAGRVDEFMASLSGRARRVMPVPAARGAGPGTVEALMAEWTAHLRADGRKGIAGVERTITKDILPRLGARPFAEVTPAECREVVEAVSKARKKPAQALKVYGCLNGAYRWARSAARFPEDRTIPTAALDPRALGARSSKRGRSAEAPELRAIFSALAAGSASVPVKEGLRVLLYTGIRSGALLGAKVDEVDLKAGTFTVPAARRKMTKEKAQTAGPFVVPLSPPALESMKRLVEWAGKRGSTWLCASPNEPNAAVNERALTVGLRDVTKRLTPDVPSHLRLRVHDLRRVVRVGLARMGVAFEVCERVLDHTLPGVAGVYAVDDLFEKRREALTRWAEHLDAVLASGGANG